ncbi:cytochrome P450 [Rhodocollybia butyracea]|uniref:Cytochrome P450 n=1 Tax=Rhodocollybia butyracea TaxID=206335 RepID=A0A9P5UFH4_9AGAR|nr:cytochrome P450 [Rhodocollybia butyracea]
MRILVQLIGSTATTVSLYGLYVLFDYIKFLVNSTIKDLSGPSNGHLLWGNLKEIIATDGMVHEKWAEEYGRTLKYRWIFGVRVVLDFGYASMVQLMFMLCFQLDHLHTMDTKALSHILTNHPIYQKPEMVRYNLTQILGAGLLVTEGDKHSVQRKIMNPAFGPSQIRELTEIFVDKSVELKDVWTSQVVAGGGVARIDVLSSLSQMTLDVIGLAGFNYKFNSLSGEPNELNKAFSTLFGNPQVKLWPIAQLLIPILRNLPSWDPPLEQAKNTMDRIGRNLLDESKASLRGNGEKAGASRDLLSLLVKSNVGGERMSDEDIIAQVPTFLVAGHETTSTATTWALYALVRKPEIQRKLREELYTLSSDTPDMDELNSLPYLDHVVRETLRVHAPVTSTSRVATKDDIIPLGTPFVDRKGVTRDSVSIQKGQTIIIPIAALNRDKSLWGEDAVEFKPERWDKLPEAVTSIPGVWGNLMTFLGGPRACIGYRFSLAEMKALLFILVRNFEFELAVPPEDITTKTTLVQRPRLKSDDDAGSQLPLLVKLYQGA